MYYTSNGVELYQGNMKLGDREASLKEVKAYEEKKELSLKVQEAIDYLLKTNHKFYNGYIKKDGEDMEAIQAKRDEALLFIRNNK